MAIEIFSIQAQIQQMMGTDLLKQVASLEWAAKPRQVANETWTTTNTEVTIMQVGVFMDGFGWFRIHVKTEPRGSRNNETETKPAISEINGAKLVWFG